ncbi:hypothetical protein [Streptomyces sp. KL116D]|uniref:hypothetical protein n=1 Tax=Streptomyces sp. KL116D TaxID=3045152 RepID=UPI0035560C44
MSAWTRDRQHVGRDAALAGDLAAVTALPTARSLRRVLTDPAQAGTPRPSLRAVYSGQIGGGSADLVAGLVRSRGRPARPGRPPDESRATADPTAAQKSGEPTTSRTSRPGSTDVGPPPCAAPPQRSRFRPG